MVDAASTPSAWSLHGTIGKLSAGALTGEVDVARPQAGFHHAAFDHKQADCSLFCTYQLSELNAATASSQEDQLQRWPLEIADAYIRGNDLVAGYRPVEGWPYSPQIYWQTNVQQSVDRVRGSLSLMVSVQTHLLDSCPKICVASQVPSGELLLIEVDESGQVEVEPVEGARTIAPVGGMFCVLRRLPAALLSYIEIMPATDFREVAFSPGKQGAFLAEWHLFADFLEKGVIRRARVHSAILPRENDVELALECCQALAHSPLPLTT